MKHTVVASNQTCLVFDHGLCLFVQGTQEYKAPEVFNEGEYVASKVREQWRSISMPVPHILVAVTVPRP